MSDLAIILPVLNEAETVSDTLVQLASLRARGVHIVVVDGGSTDATHQLAEPLCDKVLVAPRGRALQMNMGALHAQSGVLLFLHSDTQLPVEADQLVLAAVSRGALWGRFDVRIKGQSRWLPAIGALMNLRSRLTSIATGDQAMFVRRDVFEQLGGFAEIPLMEDIELSGRLRARAKPFCLSPPVTTSGRRWDRHGVWLTIVLMWRLRLRYFLGADPAVLAVEYGYPPTTPDSDQHS